MEARAKKKKRREGRNNAGHAHNQTKKGTPWDSHAVEYTWGAHGQGAGAGAGEKKKKDKKDRAPRGKAAANAAPAGTGATKHATATVVPPPPQRPYGW